MHMSNHRLISLAILVIGSVAGCVTDGSEPPDDTAARHCVFQVESDQMSCFDTFTDAMAFATQGRIADAPADAAAAATDADLEARINALAGASSWSGATLSSVVIAISYWGRDFQGNSSIHTRSYGCDGNLSTIDFENPEISDYNNNQFSSFRTFSGCAMQYYDYKYFGGAMTPISYTTAYVGAAMDDRASSIRWF
jgi:hypothetical protein